MPLTLPLSFNDDRLFDKNGKVAFGLTSAHAQEIIAAVHARDPLVDALRMVLFDVKLTAEQHQQVSRAIRMIDQTI